MCAVAVALNFRGMLCSTHKTHTSAILSLSLVPQHSYIHVMNPVNFPHIVYLRNIGVTCSMSLAIVVDGGLWGLLAFHGYKEPFKPSLHQRIACETISSMVSVRIEAVIKKAQSARVIALGDCMLSLKQEQSAIHNLFDWGDGLLEVFDADVLVGHVRDPRDEEGDTIVLGDKSVSVFHSCQSVLLA